MERLLRPILWLLLVPYFAVASLNARPWFGESRESANRTNAQLTVAFILASFEIALLAIAGFSTGWIWDEHLYLVCAGLFVPPMIAVAYLLNKQREAEYRKLYLGLPVRARWAFGLTALALVFVCWWIV